MTLPPTFAFCLTMLLGPGGRERTEAEFRHLLETAGFRLTRIVPAGLTFSVIEAMLADG